MSKRPWARLTQTIRRWLRGHSSPKLSDILARPRWHEHPLTSRFGYGKAWYVLFIPTLGEGHEVATEVGRALSLEQADITVVVAFFTDDPTGASISGTEKYSSVVALKVEAPAGDFAEMERAFRVKLQELIEIKGWPPQDVITLTLPDLQARRKVTRDVR